MTMYRVVITEICPPEGNPPREVEVERFRQTVDTLDIPRVITMINTRPRQRRNARQAGALKAA